MLLASWSENYHKLDDVILRCKMAVTGLADYVMWPYVLWSTCQRPAIDRLVDHQRLDVLIRWPLVKQINKHNTPQCGSSVNARVGPALTPVRHELLRSPPGPRAGNEREREREREGGGGGIQSVHTITIQRLSWQCLYSWYVMMYLKNILHVIFFVKHEIKVHNYKFKSVNYLK